MYQFAYERDRSLRINNIFQLSSGPIVAYERFQINFLVKRIPEYPMFSKLAGDVYLPLLWFEESFTIPLFDLGLVVGSIMYK